MATFLGERLQADGIPTRVVSMPCWELFDQQPQEYRDQVLPPNVKRLAIEAAHPMPWYRWVGSDGVIIGVDRFGASAPYACCVATTGSRPARTSASSSIAGVPHTFDLLDRVGFDAIELPSLRYLTHLVGPGWNVIGSGEPALPGVA